MCARQLGILAHAVTLMSTHEHLGVTDPTRRLPDLLRPLPNPRHQAILHAAHVLRVPRQGVPQMSLLDVNANDQACKHDR